MVIMSKRRTIFAGILLLAASMAMANAQTRTKLTPTGIRTAYKKEREGVKRAVTGADAQQAQELHCRGGALRFVVVNGRTTSSGEQTMYMTVDFQHAAQAAGLLGRNLQPGQCAFADRALRNDEPDQIIQELVSFAQLKEKLHGSAVDNSPTAAERFPDAKNVPQYLSDATHYWSFFVRQNGPLPSGRFEASYGRAWKPGLDAVQSVDSTRARDNSGVYAIKPNNKTGDAVATNKSGTSRNALIPKLLNDGNGFQLICRGGPGLRVSANHSITDFGWSIAFSHSPQPAHSGSNLQPGQCSPAEFSLRDGEPAEVQTRINNDGTVPGTELYPWETSIESVALLDASTRLSKFRDYLHDPRNYWSFFVKDNGDGSFGASYSKYWTPALYKGPQVRPFDERKKTFPSVKNP